MSDDDVQDARHHLGVPDELVSDPYKLRQRCLETAEALEGPAYGSMTDPPHQLVQLNLQLAALLRECAAALPVPGPDAERARNIVERLGVGGFLHDWTVKEDAETITRTIAAALASVRAAERERCLDICRQHYSIEGIAQKIEAAIREGKA